MIIIIMKVVYLKSPAGVRSYHFQLISFGGCVPLLFYLCYVSFS